MRTEVAKAYIVERWATGEFEELTISLRYGAGRYTGGTEIMRIRWQADRNKPNGKWYGCRVIAETSSADDLTAAAKLARQLEINWFAQPADIISGLQKKGFEQVMYDTILHEYIPVTEIAPDSKVYEITVGSVTRRVYAKTMKEARKKFLEIAADETDACDSETRQAWAEWIINQEIGELDYTPQTVPTIELMTTDNMQQ